jgi:hypothetical protein
MQEPSTASPALFSEKIMTAADHPIELKVETHPSGRWTLSARQGPGMFQQLEGELCANDDPVALYRAVAARMAVFGRSGVRFTFQDMDL